MAIVHRMPISDLTPNDLAGHPVWEFTETNSQCDTEVAVVDDSPVSNMDGRVVGVQVTLANGSSLWSMMANVDLSSPFRTKHLLTASFYVDGYWFPLARYHDPILRIYGPSDLCRVLGRTIGEVFPIRYDLRGVCTGAPDSVAGLIEAEPTETLSRDKILALIMSPRSEDALHTCRS